MWAFQMMLLIIKQKNIKRKNNELMLSRIYGSGTSVRPYSSCRTFFIVRVTQK